MIAKARDPHVVARVACWACREGVVRITVAETLDRHPIADEWTIWCDTCDLRGRVALPARET